MKIEFAEETTSLPLPEQIADETDLPVTGSPEVMKILSEGIEAAQKGDRSEARHLLLRATEEDPNNETAWLWLASISEYPEELLIFLNNVLNLNPKNERALKWAEETKSLLGKTFVQRGIEAEKGQNKEFAKQCFLQAIVHDSASELAWMWLASVSDSDEEKISHLKKVLNINPENEKASKSLAKAKTRTVEANLTKAKSAFFDGDHEKASRFVDECLSNNPKFEEALLLRSELVESIDEKIACLDEVLKINPENQNALTSLETAKFDWILSSLSSAKVEIDKGDSDKANDFLDKIIEVSPKIIDAWLLKVEVSESVDNKISHLNKVLEIDPENEFAIQGLDTQKTEKAKSLTEDAKKALSEKQKAEAQKLIERALDLAPNLEDAIIVKCQLSDSPEGKLELLNFVIAKNPLNREAADMLEDIEKDALVSVTSEARTAMDSGETKEAQKLLRQALGIAPADEDVLLLKCDMTESPEEKNEILDDLLAISPANPRALEARVAVNLALANQALAKASAAATAGNKDKAQDLLNKSFEFEPDLEAAWLLKAHISDAFDAKIECFEKVIEINTENEAAKANLLSLKAIVENSVVEEATVVEVESTKEVEAIESEMEFVEKEDSEASFDEEPELSYSVPSNEEVVEFDEIVTETFTARVIDEVSQEAVATGDNVEDSESLEPIMMPDSSIDISYDQTENEIEFDDSDADDSLIEVSSKTPDKAENESDVYGSRG